MLRMMPLRETHRPTKGDMPVAMPRVVKETIDRGFGSMIRDLRATPGLDGNREATACLLALEVLQDVNKESEWEDFYRYMGNWIRVRAHWEGGADDAE